MTQNLVSDRSGTPDFSQTRLIEVVAIEIQGGDHHTCALAWLFLRSALQGSGARQEVRNDEVKGGIRVRRKR